jgi:hypothetical protein
MVRVLDEMNRRRFLKLTGATLAGLELPGCDSSDRARNATHMPDSAPPFSSVRLHDRLDKLLDAFEAKGLRVSDTLLPPIPEAELRSLCSWFPERLPEELVSLYSWRGGQHPGPWDISEPDHPFWFRDYAFSSIESAESSYSSLMAASNQYPEFHDLLVHCFPFAEFNGARLVMPTKANGLEPKLPRPIISAFEGIDVFFYTIESMVSTCVDWVSHPRYRSDPAEWQAIELQIWRDHNPGIFEI